MVEIPQAAEKTEAERFRETVHCHLAEFHKALSSFEQTAHGSLKADGRLKHVMHALGVAYVAPTRFNISELEQCIDRFLKGLLRPVHY